MARPKEFDKEEALEAAIGVFREHGYAATSATMLTAAMGIGRQSLYDTFGDKWQLYCAAVERYSAGEAQAHAALLRSGPKAIDGIRRMIERVAAEAHMPCLGVNSVSEFGVGPADLVAIRGVAAKRIDGALMDAIRTAQADGDIDASLEPAHVAGFIRGQLTALRLEGRAGAAAAQRRCFVELAMRALR